MLHRTEVGTAESVQNEDGHGEGQYGTDVGTERVSTERMSGQRDHLGTEIGSVRGGSARNGGRHGEGKYGTEVGTRRFSSERRSARMGFAQVLVTSLVVQRIQELCVGERPCSSKLSRLSNLGERLAQIVYSP